MHQLAHHAITNNMRPAVIHLKFNSRQHLFLQNVANNDDELHPIQCSASKAIMEQTPFSLMA
jgi:hypothetical protein